MGLAIYDFLEELQAKLQPGSTFEVSDAMHHRPHGTPYAWIIDDLTCVPYQYEAIAVIDWILAEAPKHGLHCNMPKFHVWITGRPEDNVSFVEALQARGVEYSYDGLRRLLGAPIGSPSFCAKPGGHLDSVVTKASALIGQIMQIDHAQVQYLLLRFCATSSLQHCARLKSPWLLSGFAARHQEEIQGAIAQVLHAKYLTEIQRVLVGLPEYCGGIACTSTYAVMDAAFLGATGSVARFLAACKWPEAKAMLHGIALRPDYQAVVARVNECFQAEQAWGQQHGQVAGPQGGWMNGKSSQGKVSELCEIDPLQPQKLQTQKVYARAMHRLVARNLGQDLEKTDPVMASWFYSCSLPGSGAWLHASPSVGRFRVSSEVFRTMLCIRVGVAIPSAAGIKHCVHKCDYAGPSLQNGRHYFSQCNKLSYNGVRHSTVVAALRTMLQQAGFEVIMGETADWVIGAPEKRPFDLCFRLEAADPWSCFDVGVADPTRHGYLPIGNRFFKRAQAAERYAGKKKSTYAALVRQHSLKKKVDYAPVIFEVSGGFPDSVSQLLDKATEVASKNKVKLAAADWSWSAMDWSSFHAQVLSFEINKMTALAVLNGLRSAVAAVEAAN